MDNFMLKAEGKISYGQVDYDGQLSDGSAYTINNIDDYISLASAYLRLGLRQDAISALTVVGSLRPDYKATADAYIEQIKAGKSP